jgi:two-component system chemotaxis response regulator CheB
VFPGTTRKPPIPNEASVTRSDQENEHDSGSKADRRRVRVLIVDDSALMRRLLTDLLTSSPEIEIAGVARDGRDAVVQALKLKPDVITLDVEMPEVSGLEALPALLAVHEAPIVMISALTREGADVTLQALELGAVDFVHKPDRNQLAEMRASRDILVSKVLAAAQSRVRRPRRSSSLTDSKTSTSASAPRAASTSPPTRRKPPTATATSSGPPSGCIVIGISTGGPQALSQVFPLLTLNSPPILVVQHMPGQFTGIFAERLDRYCPLAIKQAEEGDLVLPDRILIAPGGRHMTLTGHPPRVKVTLSDEPPVSGHRPSVDVLFQSAAKVFQSTATGLIMTGMGRDGVDGCKALLAAGGFTLGQDEATSVVYGMNKAAFLESAIKAQFALDELPDIVRNTAAYRAEFDQPKD